MTISARDSILSALRPLARIITAKSARIFMYHRFGPAGSYRRMPVDMFERQVRYLRNNYTVISLSDLVEKVSQGESLAPRCVAITVDDGYSDFMEYAYPVLEKYNVPATVYLVSGFVDQSLWLWFDVIHYILEHAEATEYELSLLDRSSTVRLEDEATRNALWETLAHMCVSINPSQRRVLIESLAEQLSVQVPATPTFDYRAMSWDAIRSVDPALIEWGGHTVSHPILSKCTPEQQLDEIKRGKLRVEEMIQRPVNAFCYPNGQVGDYDEHAIAAVKQAGFHNAVVAHGGMLWSGFDPYRIERLGAPDNEDDFYKCVDGIWEIRRQALAGFTGFRGRPRPSASSIKDQ